MIMNVYVIYDKVSSSVATGLLCSENDPIMMRTIKSAKLGAVIEENLEDFDLYQIATVDPVSCEIVPCEKRFVAHLEAFKNA